MIKDRYTQALTIATLGTALFLYAVRNGQSNLAKAGAFFAIIGVGYFFFTGMSAGRVVKNEFEGTIGYKGETDCGFSSTPKEALDGLALPQRKRYKIVNGADVIIAKDGTVRPLGPGSGIMQVILGGGFEPASIQADNCWRFPE